MNGAKGKQRGPRLRPFTRALATLALSACARGPMPEAPSAASPAPPPAPSASAAIAGSATGTPPVRRPADIAGECRIEGSFVSEPVGFDWEKMVARGPSAAINALAATGDAVFVAGAESRERAQSEPFLAAFDADGRERYRVTFDQPRSTTTPPRAAAVAVACTASGEAYVVSTAARVDGSGAVVLSLVDARGRIRFSTPLGLSVLTEPSLVVEPSGDVIVAGSSPSGQEYAVLKQTHDGARVWSKTYAVSGGALRLVRLGQRLLLVGSLGGTAEFGAARLARSEKVEYHCAGDAHRCEERAVSLLVAELGPTGEPLHARLLGPANGRLLVSGVAVAGDGLLVTGEYQGPPIELGKVALCELESGMPEPSLNAFRELGGGPHCSCRRDRRDLFLLALDAHGEPRWAKTLALGSSTPRVSADSQGEIRWAAEIARTPTGTRSTADESGELALWSLDARGEVSTRREAPGGLRQIAAGPGALYVSDQRAVRKLKW